MNGLVGQEACDAEEQEGEPAHEVPMRLYIGIADGTPIARA